MSDLIKRPDRINPVDSNVKEENVLCDNVDDLVAVLKCPYVIKNGIIYLRPYVFIHSKNEKIDYRKAIINPEFEGCKLILKVESRYFERGSYDIRVNRSKSNYSNIDGRLRKLFNSDELYNVLDKKILDELNVEINFVKTISREYLNLNHYSSKIIIENNSDRSYYNNDIIVRFDRLINEYRKIDKLKDLNDGEIISRGVKCLLNSINRALNEGLDEIKKLYKDRFINKLNDLEYLEMFGKSE